MSRCKAISIALILANVLFLETAVLRGQDQSEANSKPKSAARSVPALDDSGTYSDDNNKIKPDETSLTGVQNATLGTSELRHSYWVPGIQYASLIQSNPSNIGGKGWYADNYLTGNLSLLKAWSRSQFVVNYSGGGYFSTNSALGNQAYHQLVASETLKLARFTLLFQDQFSYLPQSQFGFAVGTNLDIPGVGGSLNPVIPGLGTSYVPNQSIYSSLGPRYSNASVVQGTYQLTSRASVSVAGSYGTLSFVDPGNVDTNMTVASVSYNYAFNPKDTIGLVYRFTADHYHGQPQAFGYHVGSVAYGRKLTGRLALQLLAGPSYTSYRIPVNGSTGAVGADVNANLTAAWPNGGVNAGYLHGLTGGSGVVTGANTDQVLGGVNHRLGRVWNGNLNVGFGHNKAVALIGSGSPTSYNTVFAGAGVSRPATRNLSIGINYEAAINTYGQSGCTGTACQPSQTTQYVSINFQWHTRPFVLP